MNRSIDDIYSSIAQHLSDCIHEDWDNITLEVERDNNDVIGFSGDYISINGELKYLDVGALNDQVDDDFNEIYAIMTENGDNNKWNRATFKLKQDGKFSIDFDWDQVLADEVSQFNS